MQAKMKYLKPVACFKTITHYKVSLFLNVNEKISLKQKTFIPVLYKTEIKTKTVTHQMTKNGF